MNDTFAVVIGLLCLVISFYVGTLVEGVNRGFDCKNYGKTQINSKWYDCKPKGE